MTPFLAEARATLLARYAKYRSDALDAVLERAGIRSYFADYAGSCRDTAELRQAAASRIEPPV